MRLIIPHAYNVPGGVEKTAVSLIGEFIKLIERVIFVLPPDKIAYFKELFAGSDRLIYESFTPPPSAKREIFDSRLNYLIKKHKATHCLYMITGGQAVPEVNIPLAVIGHDLYWHFKPELYSESFRQKRDKNLREWLGKADFLFTVSNSTRDDVVKLFPQFQDKIKIILNAVDINEIFKKDTLPARQDKMPFFFYPASHAGYQKNFATLFKAAHRLASKGLNFKLVIAGRETEKLTGDQPFSGRQDEEARLFFKKKRDLLNPHIKVLGFCEREKIEALYRDCLCVVLPSRYEGFGLPLAEALARGSYIICSDIATYREQVALYNCNDMVHFFSLDDIDLLAKYMEKFLLKPKEKLPLEQIKERFSHWTWQDVAREYIHCLENII